MRSILITVSVILISLSSARADFDVDLHRHCKQHHGRRAYALPSTQAENGWLCARDEDRWYIDLHGACKELGGSHAVYVGDQSNNGWRCVSPRSAVDVQMETQRRNIDLDMEIRRKNLEIEMEVKRKNLDIQMENTRRMNCIRYNLRC